MTTTLIFLSIWYLIGFVACIIATYINWRAGHAVRIYHIPLNLLFGVLGPTLIFMLWGDQVSAIGGWTLIRGRKKP